MVGVQEENGSEGKARSNLVVACCFATNSWSYRMDRSTVIDLDERRTSCELAWVENNFLSMDHACRA